MAVGETPSTQQEFPEVKTSGLFVAVAGVWVITQVLAGEALQRLKVI